MHGATELYSSLANYNENKLKEILCILSIQNIEQLGKTDEVIIVNEIAYTIPLIYTVKK